VRGDLHYEIGREPGDDGPPHRQPRSADGVPDRVETPAPRSALLCCSRPRFAFDVLVGQGAHGMAGRMNPVIAERGAKSVGPK